MTNNPYTTQPDPFKITSDSDQKTMWPIYLVAGVIFIFFLVIAIKSLTPELVVIPEPDLNTNNNTAPTTFTNMTYSGENPNFPIHLAVAKTVKSTTTESYVFDQLVSELDLKERTNANNVWNGPEYSLIKNASENRYSLSINSTTDLFDSAQPENNEMFSKERAIKAANESINSLFPDLNLELQQNEITYIDGGYEYHSEDTEISSSTEMAIIRFSPAIDGIPVYYQNNTGFPFQVTINNDYNVQKLVFNTFFDDFEHGNNIDLISINKAIDNINNDLGSLIWTDYQGSENISLANISAGQMDSVSLEYRVDESIGLSYPYYRFSGKISIPSHSKLNAEIITPAVETQPRSIN